MAYFRTDTNSNSARGNKNLPEWIHPYNNKTLQNNFTYQTDGKISSSADCKHPDEAETTITQTLKLNSWVLKDIRAQFINDFHYYIEQKYSFEDIKEIYNHKFTSVIEQWFKIHSNAL